MNRRSFIAKALAGLAAVPLIGKLIDARSVDDLRWPASSPESIEVIEDEPWIFVALFGRTEEGLKEISAPSYRRMPLREFGKRTQIRFPATEERWGNITHYGLSSGERDRVLIGPLDLNASLMVHAGDTITLSLEIRFT